MTAISLAAGQLTSDNDRRTEGANRFFAQHDGLISKKVNQDKWKALQNDPQMAQVKQAAQMGVEINYTTTIVLPRPVKKIDNAIAKLSDDKKTVVMKFNLIDAFDHPERFEYTIAY